VRPADLEPEVPKRRADEVPRAVDPRLVKRAAFNTDVGSERIQHGRRFAAQERIQPPRIARAGKRHGSAHTEAVPSAFHDCLPSFGPYFCLEWNAPPTSASASMRST